jgi:ABC-type transport system involved in cytochrome bd biosynthesis fused ATPase/permease subunit
MAEKIFLSYAYQDRHLVQSVEKALRKHKIVTAEDVVILDPQKKLDAGENVREWIKDAISSVSKVVIIASNDSAASQWVNYEAGMAAALGKPIVVIGRKGAGKSALVAALENVQSIEI